MTIKQIAERQAKQNVAYDVARKIREMLDLAKKEYGAQAWDDDEIENKIAELAFDE